MRKFNILIILFILIISYTNTLDCASKKKRRAKSSSVFSGKVLFDSTLYPGLKYLNYQFGNRKLNISANVLEVDLNNPRLQVSVLKSKNNISELDKLHEIIRFNDSLDETKTFAAINASFWKAFRNYPIGACIINGSVVEKNPYKEWSGIFFDKKGVPFIDNFKLSGTVKLYDGKIITLSSVNRRSDSVGVVLYNHFGGDIIPHVNMNAIYKIINDAYSEILMDSTYFEHDSTEKDFDYIEFERNLVENARTEQLESSIQKAVVEFIDKPGINCKFRAVVNYIDTGIVKINSNQAVLSMGFNLPPDLIVYMGDTLEFMFETNIHKDVEFQYAATATPRLVRKGKAGHEAYLEGSKGRRFINGQLGRTAIGYDQYKNKLFLVTIDHGNRSTGKKGSTLSELAQIMKQIGCYDAMNLDGGGSSVMVIDGKNVMSKNNPGASRRISVAIGVRYKK